MTDVLDYPKDAQRIKERCEESQENYIQTVQKSH